MFLSNECILALCIKSSCLLDWRALYYWHDYPKNTAEFTTCTLLHTYCILTGFQMFVTRQWCYTPVIECCAYLSLTCSASQHELASLPQLFVHHDNDCTISSCHLVYHFHRCSGIDVCCRWHVGSLEDDEQEGGIWCMVASRTAASLSRVQRSSRCCSGSCRRCRKPVQ